MSDMINYIFLELPPGFELRITRKPRNGKYHRAAIFNRIGGCIYSVESSESLEDLLQKIGSKIENGIYL